MIKVMTVFGTRPEAIKMAPVVLELQKHADRIQTIVAVTAQHRQMLDQVLDLFQITPDYDLDIMSQGQTLYDITTKSLMGLKDVLAKEKPDLVLVHGDDDDLCRRPGLVLPAGPGRPRRSRSADRGHLFALPGRNEPQADRCHRSHPLHAPTATAKANLLKENVNPSHIYVTGNTVIDALMMTVAGDYDFGDDLKDVDFHNHRVIAPDDAPPGKPG